MRLYHHIKQVSNRPGRARGCPADASRSTALVQACCMSRRASWSQRCFWVAGNMSQAAREDVLQMLANRLRDDPAAVLELLEQTTAALLERQADPGHSPPQSKKSSLQAKRLSADHAAATVGSKLGGRPSQRPATSGHMPTLANLALMDHTAA